MARQWNNSINIMEQAEMRLVLNRNGRNDWKVSPTQDGAIIRDAGGKTLAKIVQHHGYWHEIMSQNIAYQLPSRNQSEKWPGGRTVARALQGVLHLYAWHVETEKRATCRQCQRRRLCRAFDLESAPICRQCRSKLRTGTDDGKERI